eukprot:TRINITY_DN4586_c0_g2_i8.p1 TRINITY_DN4586_c0_g2~~TRINITY_DN4586_c0_g2_i8.p1  ORF type:complete len:341 (-),score=77.01 TRINITY_DN4586_c0_g2_i8:67-1089(-)
MVLRQLMHVKGDAREVAEAAASTLGCMAGVASRRCCRKKGEAAARDRSPLKQRGMVEVGEMEPPPPAPRRQRMKPPLLKAIENGSIAQVRAVLELEVSLGDASIRFLSMDDFEPALCCAVRTGQNEEMVQMLLRYGADANESKVGGRSALSHLCSTQSDSEESTSPIAPTLGGTWMPPSFCFAGFDAISMPVPGSFGSLGPFFDTPVPEEPSSANSQAEAWQLRMGTLLLAAGADSDACDFTGATLAEIARKSGKHRLACLLQYYGIAQVMFVIGRVLGTSPAMRLAGPPVGRISEGILRMICGFLAPEGSESTLLRIGALLLKKTAAVKPEAESQQAFL